MAIEITTRKHYPVEDEVLFSLFQWSFQQWHDNGIKAKFLSQDLTYFKRATRRAVVILAISHTDVLGHTDSTDNTDSSDISHQPSDISSQIVGMLCVNCYKDKHAYDFYLTVSPEAKQQGVGTKMFNYAVAHLKERGYRYLIDTTSVEAIWSIRWHLKNGYRIVGYGKGQQGYSSTYLFRKQIEPFNWCSPSSWLWNGPQGAVTAKCCYLFWRMVRWFTQKGNGDYNALGSRLRAFKHRRK